MINRLIFEKDVPESTPVNRKFGHLSLGENMTNKLRTLNHTEQHKKGVMRLVSDRIKSTYVETFNKRAIKFDNLLETFMAQRLSSGRDTSKEFDFKKSFNIVSNKKDVKEPFLLNEKPLNNTKDKYYSMKTILLQGNSKYLEAKIDEKDLMMDKKKLNENCLDHPILKKAILSSKQISHQTHSNLANYQRTKKCNNQLEKKKSISKKDSNNNSFNFSKFLNSPNSRANYANAGSQIDADENTNTNIPKFINQESLKKRNCNNPDENNNLSSSHTDLQKVSYLINNDVSPSHKKLVKNRSFIHHPATSSDLEILEYKLSIVKEFKANHAKRLKENLTSLNREGTRHSNVQMDNEKLRFFLKKKSTSPIKSFVEVVKDSPPVKEKVKQNNHKFVSKLIQNGSTDKNLIKVFNKMNKENCQDNKGKKHSKKKKMILNDKNDRFHMLKLELVQYKENKRIILHRLSKAQKDCDEYLTNFRKIVNMEKHKTDNNKKVRKISG